MKTPKEKEQPTTTSVDSENEFSKTAFDYMLKRFPFQPLEWLKIWAKELDSYAAHAAVQASQDRWIEHPKAKEAIELLKYFVDRVDAGTIRSHKTYAMYKNYLATLPQPPHQP